MTGLVVWSSWVATHARDQARFENLVQRNDAAIQARVELCVGLLRATAGYFASRPAPSPEEFGMFAGRIDLHRNYPGAQGIGLAEKITGPLTAFEATMRARGRQGFSVAPPGDRDEAFPIAYLEPMDRRNIAAIGYDMFSESTRRDAMQRARDNGVPAASGRVILVQEIDENQQPGFLIYVPVYRGGEVPTTPEHRRERLTGFAYSPFRTGDLFRGVIAEEQSPRIHFAIYAGQPGPETLLFESANGGRTPWLTTTTKLQVADRQWTVRYKTGPGFARGSTRDWVAGLGITGLLLSGIFSGITLALARAAWRAREHGREMLDQRERYRVTLASIGDAVIATDARGSVSFMNSVAEKLTGWPFSEAHGRRLDEVFPLVNEESGEPVTNPVAKVLRDGAIVGLANHTALRTRAGTTIPIEDSAAPIRDARGELAGVVLVFHDVRAARSAEEALALSEARKDAILRSALDAIVTIDHESKIIAFNPAAEQIFGYARDEAIGQSLPELIIPERYRERHYRGMAHYLVTGEGPVLRRRIEVAAQRRDGTEFPVELAILPIPNATPPIFTAFLRDISERKEAEGKLREAAERFRFMAESMPPKIFTTDGRGRFDYFNRQWTDFTGIAAADLQFGDWRALHPDDAAETQRRWRTALASGDPLEVEHRLRRHDGEYRWHLTRARALRNPAGEVSMWIGSSTDIDDKKRESERLEHLVANRTTELRELNAQLEDFVYAVAHDLRGPLRGIAGFAEVLADESQDNLSPEALRALTRIQSSSEAMERLIRDLLTFSRTARAEMELGPVSVEDAWQQAVAQNAAEIERSHARVETVGGLPRVMAHEATLTQVLANLLGNALKFVPADTPPAVRIGADDAGQRVRLWIEDNGIGIPPDQHERIFRVFERGHGNRYAGTGIGLSIVRKGVERMGGAVGVKSGVGRGSCFWVELAKAA